VAFADQLSQDGRMLSVVSTQKLVSDFSSAFTLINTVVYVIIVLAAALSFTVVFTLSNTNISERERELATIKVLGFKRPEVHRYINKETLILTGMGVVCGLPLGYALARSLTWILRMPSLYFDVVVDPATYVISAAFACAFTLIVNALTNRSLDRVDMVGALKSAE
jgi:putative ABC transport system permease protein